MALTAPDRGDPALRHFEAKIHLIERRNGEWHDLGPVLPDRTVPYEREWAGSAVTQGADISLYFTGAGVNTRPGGFQQALYEAHARLGPDGLPSDWSIPRPSVGPVSPCYQAADAHEGEPGRIKAFRDPSWFRDPADGTEYLVFTASLAGSTSDYNGAVGIARRAGTGWQLLPPLIHADGVNNELERAHVVAHGGRYYVFWATQRGTFEPRLRHAPNGLYGMVADSLFGDYRPLNGSGLVLANPDAEPSQTYSWFVTADLVVSSFVDFWGLNGRPIPAEPAAAAACFGGVPAPLLQLEIEGDRCRLSETVLK
jgi:levansucrase